MARERAKCVTVIAFNLSTIHNPSALTARETISAREESRGERIEFNHGNQCDGIKRELERVREYRESRGESLSQGGILPFSIRVYLGEPEKERASQALVSGILQTSGKVKH
jgi:hypothetical protein